MAMDDYHVMQIGRAPLREFILQIHYAKRWPSISFAYALIKGWDIVGVVTYGSPPSSPLREGICGPDFADKVIELNRLCLRNNIKNEASFLVGRSMAMLKGNRIVVSFADTAQDHVGYVYQATNFIYTGLSAKRTNWAIEGKNHLHGITIADQYRHKAGRAAALREEYGDAFKLEDRSRKHRYIKFLGTRKFRREALAALRYPQEPYPKAHA